MHFNQKMLSLKWPLLATGAIMVMSSPIAAQTAQNSASDSLAEIVVTAQKRTQNLQDVGVAVTAVGAAAMKLAVVPTDSTTLAKTAPSLQVSQYSPSQVVFNIRGVSQNDFSDVQEGPIAFYNDEVYIGSLGGISGQTFDLERVEILRGPQGTLFGRNATGGLIQAVTKKPTDHLDGYATITGGSYGQITAEGAIGGPLSDSVRVRLSGITDHNHGYIENALPGHKNGGNTRFYGFRGQLAADLTERDKLSLKVEFLRNDHERSNTATTTVSKQDPVTGAGTPIGPNDFAFPYSPTQCAGCDVYGFRPSGNPWQNSSDYPGIFDRTYWNAVARYEHDFGGVQLTSITNYQHLNKTAGMDFDGTPDVLVQGTLGVRVKQLSEELRLSGKTDRLTWVAGLYGLQIKAKGDATVFFNPADQEVRQAATNPFITKGSFLTVVNSAYDQNTRSLAGFGQMEYKLTDVFAVIGGFRYNVDWKRYSYTNVLAAPAFGPFAIDTYDFNARRPDLRNQTFKNWNGKIQLNAKLNRNVLLYAGVNRGTKGGGFNVPNVFPSALAGAPPAAVPGLLVAFDNRIVFKQEVLTNYEGGFKLTSADRRATLNGSFFHYVYSNYQAFTNQNANTLIINLPARVTGAELEASYRPVRNLTATAFLTHMFQREARGIPLQNGALVNSQLPQTPSWSFGGSLSYEQTLGEVGSLTFSTDWKYNSKHYLTIFNFPEDFEPGYAVGDVRIAFQPENKKFEAAFFINNVSNKAYRVFVGDNSVTSATESVYGRPRWFGGSLSYNF